MAGERDSAGPTLVVLTGRVRPVVAAHLDRLRGRFGAAGWRVVDTLPSARASAGIVAAMSDPFLELAPTQLQALAEVRMAGPPRWRIPIGWGLPGSLAVTSHPPATLLEYERRWLRRRRFRKGPSPWTGLAVAASADADVLLARGWPPAAADTAVCESVRVFRYSDPAGHTREELVPFVPSDARRVVDVGCGEGRLAALLRQRGHAVLGVEPDRTLALAASARVPVLALPGEQGLEAVRPGVDCIVFADVLEHTPEPVALLAAAGRVLSARGVIVVSFPNAAWAPVVLALAAGRWDASLAGVQAADHLFFTTPTSFARLAREAGFSVLRLEPLGSPLPLKTRTQAWMLALLAGGAARDLAAAQWVAVLRRT